MTTKRNLDTLADAINKARRDKRRKLIKADIRAPLAGKARDWGDEKIKRELGVDPEELR